MAAMARRSTERTLARRDPSLARLRFEVLEDRRLLSFVPELLKDIGPNDSSVPQQSIEVSGLAFFTANDGSTGDELWKSDGTEAGTVLVKDIIPGASGSGPSFLTNFNGALFFGAFDGIEHSLWKSDGTLAGTVLVKDFVRVGTSLTNVNGTLFFSAYDATTGEELWKSDGTEAGTMLVKDIRPGNDPYGYPLGSGAFRLANVNGTLFFTADDGITGSELWKSDGSEAGTMLVKDIRPGNDVYGFPYGSGPDEMANLNGTLIFSANDGATGIELWRSDGTEMGTALVKDIRPGLGTYGDYYYGYWTQPRPSSPSELTNVGGTLFFAAKDETYGRELWKSDGSEAGTMLVKDIAPGSLDDVPRASVPDHLTIVGGTLFFSVVKSGAGLNALWKSDGTEAGTIQLIDFGGGASPQFLTNVNGTLFFGRSGGSQGLWKSDGSEAGTVEVKDIIPGPTNYDDIGYLANVNGVLFFYAHDDRHGIELWKSDGSELGTVLVRDINTDITTGSSEGFFTEAGAITFFVADDFTHGKELWKTDGTEAGTLLVKDINPGVANGLLDGYSGIPQASSLNGDAPLANVNGTVFFCANDGSTGNDLWKSDGTEAGTARVKDLFPGLGGVYLRGLTNVNGILFFTVYFIGNSQSTGDMLWKSDGTEAGTVLVKDVRPAYVHYPVSVNGTLFFITQTENLYTALWNSDGTQAGTVGVKEVFADELTNVNGTLFFRGYDATHGWELWRSNGTEAGTVLAADIYAGSTGSAPFNLTNVGGTLFFAAESFDAGAGATRGRELWKRDAATGDFALVKDIFPGTGGSLLGVYDERDSFTGVNDVLFFYADDGTNGDELWKSDGTEAGTTLVKDVRPGTSGSFRDLASTAGLSEPVNVNGTLFFVADDGAHGAEIWQSDGTELGTLLIGDLAPGPDGSSPSTTHQLANGNGKLFFSANDRGVHGTEPWILRESTPATITGRRIFYNQSKYDGNTSGIAAADSAAIDTSKTAYVPGAGSAITPASMTSYDKGINGIFVEITGTHGTLTLSDFQFAVSGSRNLVNNTPSTWVAAPDPILFTVLSDTPTLGTDRVEFIWANGAITNRYLEVTTEGNDAGGGSNTNTGLAASDTFYFGSLIGDEFTGFTSTTFSVTGSDELAVRVATPAFNLPVTNVLDFDKNSALTANDQIVSRINVGAATGGFLFRINIPGPPPPPPAGDGGGSDSAVASALALLPAAPSKVSASVVDGSQPSGGGVTEAVQRPRGLDPGIAFVLASEQWRARFPTNAPSSDWLNDVDNELLELLAGGLHDLD